MDLTINIGEYKLNIRAAIVIIHNNKILVHKNTNSNHYALPGGRVELGESSDDTVKRELIEELGKEVELTEYVATIENFFEMKDSKYHEILFIHKGEFVDDEDKKIEYALNNIEGKEHLKYEWIELDRLDEYRLLPDASKKVLIESNFPVHRVNKDL